MGPVTLDVATRIEQAHMQHQPPPSRGAPSFSTPSFFPFANVPGGKLKLYAGGSQVLCLCGSLCAFLVTDEFRSCGGHEKRWVILSIETNPRAVGAELVARGLSLLGGASSEVRRCNCSGVP